MTRIFYNLFAIPFLIVVDLFIYLSRLYKFADDRYEKYNGKVKR